MDEKAQQNLGISLAGRILITPPGLDDIRFSNALTLVIEHSIQGAIGLIINRPTLTPIEEILPEWSDLSSEPGVIFAGGPVDHDALLAIGRSKSNSGELVLGAYPVDLDDQPELVKAQGIEAVRVFSGYVGWSAGQLEDEIDNDFWWLANAASIEDLFTNSPSNLWKETLLRQGNPLKWYAHYPLDINSN